MASENETFDEVLRCIQNDIVHFVGKPVKHSRDLLQEYHDRFKAAHQLEVAELRKGISELLDALQAIYDEECTGYGTGEVYYRWRKALQDEGGEK